jgi:hypothetical protein
MAKQKRGQGAKSGRKSSTRTHLSLSMIVKDEAEFIAGCLQSVQGVVDEIIVVDTGSRDDTAAIAERMGARVFYFPWVDDFAAARNHGLAQCRGEWVLALDADEQLDPADRRLIREAVTQPKVDAWYLRFVNMIDGKPSGGEVRLLRLFRRTPDTRYVGRIHEQPIQNIPNATAGYCASTIRHYGYREPVMERKQKLARNIRLLELGLQDTENDGNPMLRSSYLHYWALNAWEPQERLRRFELFAQCVETEFDKVKDRMAWVPSGLVHYALCLRDHGRRQESAALARRILERFGEAPLLHALIAGGLVATGELEPAKKELAVAMAPGAAIAERHREDVMPAEVAPRLATIVLAEILERQWLWAEAETVYRDLVPEIEEVRPRLVYTQVMQEKYESALQTLNQGKKSLAEVSPDLSCLAFILALIVQSGPGLFWWGEKVRLAASSHRLSASVLERLESWDLGAPFTAAAFPELPQLIHLPVPVQARAQP